MAEASLDQVIIRPLDRPGDLGWVVMARGEMYNTEFGWDTTFEALVARIVADYATDHDLAREAAWTAEIHGVRVGCNFRVVEDAVTAKLRILLVHPGLLHDLVTVGVRPPVRRSGS